MPLTSSERAVFAQLRANPARDVAELARVLGASISEVTTALDALTARGLVRGRGFLLAERPPIVVVGGANMDSKMRAIEPWSLHSSTPGRATWSAGGVGRNIAENLARLGNNVELIAPVGNDINGTDLLSRTEAGGVGVSHVIRTKAPTGIYVALLDEHGELILSMSDMSGTDGLTVRSLTAGREVIGGAELLILDGNLPEVVCCWLLDFAAAAGIPVLIDPVSVAKALHLQTSLNASRPVFMLTPNVDEVEALVGDKVGDALDALASAAQWFHRRGVANVWIRRGPQGSLLSMAEDGQQVVSVLPAPPATVVDVTGAGDSMTAGFVHCWLEEYDVVKAACFGQVTASLTVEVPQTVNPDLSSALVESRLTAYRSSLGRQLSASLGQPSAVEADH